ncbi:MAG: DUF86 domain-containing protein [Nitrospirae bacterium]|nr:DUF86 domain-containing protein [Nitrospirota bacterium]
MTREYKLYIQDILDAIKEIEKYVEGMDYDQFLDDSKTKSAVVWKIETIGEASKNIPQTIKTKHKEIPWKDMSRIRDKIAHFYFGINYKIVWEVIKKRLPEIKPVIVRILSELS